MTLKDACIARDGVEDGTSIYNTIIEDCANALETGQCHDIEGILYDEGFEPDYIMDIIDVLS